MSCGVVVGVWVEVGVEFELGIGGGGIDTS